MFAEYQRQVLLTYHQKKAEHTLSLNLIHSTPAKLRAECAAVFIARHSKKDEQILQTFFGPHDDEPGYIHTIKRFDIDKFRPLDNFLKKQIVRPDEKNIELLAWLIDFQPRPWQWDFDYAAARISLAESIPEAGTSGSLLENGENDQEERLEITQEKQEETGTKTSIKTVPVMELNKAPSISRRILITAFILLALSGAGGYWILTSISLHEQCMCWTGDHYRRVSCKQRPGENPVYAMDSLKLEKFKRITTPDTLTANAIGRVWYSKINGNIEYYTADGFHPVHTERRLHPLTVYMLNRHNRSPGR